MRRREFVLGLPAAQGALAQAKGERICVSSWSFHNLFSATRDEDAPAAGKPLDVLDFPEMIADRYQVHHLEIVSPHFASREAAYIRDFKARLERAHSRLVNVPLDFDELWEKPALSATDRREREKAISMYAGWIDIAHELGARSVRCDPGRINLADLAPTIDSYQKLVARGRSKGIRVIVENHGSAAAHPEALVKVLEAAGAGALPDFGNFPDEATRERGLRLLFPLAVTVCHAKLNPGRFDFGRCMRIAKETGYQGLFSIEAGGRGDPYEAVRQVLEALVENL
jgi:sugar phosphate isomerase/epimerase